jgi:hypothetical protein
MGDRSLDVLLESSGEYTQWDWSRSPIQQDYLLCTEPYSLMSGGFGTGKTTVLCNKVALLSMGIPGNLGYLGRLDGKALKQTTLQVLLEMLPKGSYTKNDQAGLLTFKPEYGGSKMVYGDFKDLNDLKNHPLGWFAIDQLEECPQEVWDYLIGRLRRRIPILSAEGKRQYSITGVCPRARNSGRHFAYFGDTKCLWCAQPLPLFNDRPVSSDTPAPWDLLIYNRYGTGVANPEDPSHWLYKYFPGLPSYHGLSGPGKEGYKAFHATTYDGLAAGFIDSKYVKDLERNYSKDRMMFDRYLMGIWVAAEGLVYKGWNRKDNYINAWSTRHDGSELVPRELGAFEYIDHGLTAPTAVGWVVPVDCPCGCRAVDFFVVAEHYVGGRGTQYHASCIKNIRTQLARPIEATFLDSQAFSRTQVRNAKELSANPNLDDLYSYADQYIDEEIFVLPNQKNWEAGYDRIVELLTIDPNHKHPVTGKLGAPHLYVFDTCVNFRNEIEGYKWKKVKASENYKEEPVDKDDHLMDGLNGFMTSRPIPIHHIEPAKDPDAWWLKELDAMDIHRSGHMSA